MYLVARIIYPSKPVLVVGKSYSEDVYHWEPPSHPEVIVHKSYTAKELQEYDGKGSERILLAIMRAEKGFKERTVFDVTAGKSFYGPGKLFIKVKTDL